MFKRILSSLLMLMFSGASNSALFEYKFTGTVSNYTDAAGIIESSPYDLSNFVKVQTVEYVFLIGLDAAGEQPPGGATLETITESEYSYSVLVSGLLIESTGRDYNTYSNDLAMVNGSSGWTLDSTWYGYERAFNAVGEKSEVFSTLYLKSISEVPVPAIQNPTPATFLLFGTALIGFVGFSRRTVVT